VRWDSLAGIVERRYLDTFRRKGFVHALCASPESAKMAVSSSTSPSDTGLRFSPKRPRPMALRVERIAAVLSRNGSKRMNE
jgi:hypothetical protein